MFYTVYIKRRYIVDIDELGIDIIKIERVEKSIQSKKFVDFVFSKNEQEYCGENAGKFAGRFAAKEAVFKTMPENASSLTWLDVEIIPGKYGEPIVIPSEKILRLYPNSIFKVSISHCKDDAVAVAMRIKKKKQKDSLE